MRIKTFLQNVALVRLCIDEELGVVGKITNHPAHPATLPALPQVAGQVEQAGLNTKHGAPGKQPLEVRIVRLTFVYLYQS